MERNIYILLLTNVHKSIYIVELDLEKDKNTSECCDVIDISIFMKYWKILKKNYSDTKHDDADAKLYFHCFKNIKKVDFSRAITNVLKYSQYFPRIDEIQRYLPTDENFFHIASAEEISDYDWINE